MTAILVAFICEFQIAERLPFGGQRSFEEIAEDTKLDVNDVRRMLRMCVAENFFIEEPQGFIRHSSATQSLVEVPFLSAFLTMNAQENAPALIKV